MKIFFSLLLLANIGFGLMQWLLPYEQLFVETTEIDLSERLRLLNEPEKSANVDNENSVYDDSSILVSENLGNQLICYTVGPFKDKTRALEISGRYSSNNIEAELKSSQEKEYLGIMVFLAGHESRAEAVKTAEKLATQGFRDYIIVNETDKTNVLSLGVFGLKKNAERLSAKLRKMDYPVETEARYRDRIIYWIYYRRSNENEMALLIDQADIDKGISQIPGQCA